MRSVSELLADGWSGDLTTLPYLRLLTGLTKDEAARICAVSPETFRRWYTDRKPNAGAIRLLSVVAGYVPWRGWDGWEVHNGYLFPPGYSRGGLRPADILALPFMFQLLEEYRRQLGVAGRRPTVLEEEPAETKIRRWRSL